jgi:glycerophosphoryl diester phosphodiesterase
MKIEMIAHRGFSSIAPENTLAAFWAAIQSQADSIELDVQLSADGMPMVFHDTTLERTAGITGTIQEKTLVELKQLEVGSWFDPQYADEKIPTLREVLETVKSLPKFIYLDVKKHCHWSDKDIENLVNLLVSENWQNRCIISSFNEIFVDRVRQLDPEIQLGYIVAEPSLYLTQLAKAKKAGNTVMISAWDVLLKNPDFIQMTQSSDVDIVVWTVDEIEIFQKLVNLGLQRIVTNKLIDNFNPLKVG